jgi:hypothetical protein
MEGGGRRSEGGDAPLLHLALLLQRAAATARACPAPHLVEGIMETWRRTQVQAHRHAREESVRHLFCRRAQKGCQNFSRAPSCRLAPSSSCTTYPPPRFLPPPVWRMSTGALAIDGERVSGACVAAPRPLSVLSGSRRLTGLRERVPSRPPRAPLTPPPSVRGPPRDRRPGCPDAERCVARAENAAVARWRPAQHGRLSSLRAWPTTLSSLCRAPLTSPFPPPLPRSRLQ